MKLSHVCFTSLVACATSAILGAQDVTQLLLVKGAGYQQSGPGQPTATGQAYVFHSEVDVAQTGIVSAVSLKFPSGTTQALVFDNQDRQWSFDTAFLSPGGLNGDFPNGSYTFTVQASHDGTRIVPLTLAGSLLAAPQLLNYADAQAINPAAAFTLNWNALAGGTAQDFVRLRVEDASGNRVFETPELGKPGALNGLSPNGFTLPANLLAPGTAYSAELLFAHASQVDATTYGQSVIAYAGYYAATQFPLGTTTGADVKQIILLKAATYQQSGAGLPVLASNTKPYQFFGSFQLGKSNGVNSASVTLPGGFVDPLALNGDRDEWRVKADYLSLGGLNGDFPDGAYSFTINAAHDGTRIVPLTLTGGGFPNIPQVGNFSAAQAVSPAVPFTVQWNAFSGGTVADFVSFEVEDASGKTLFETPGVGEPGALTGTSPTSLTLPASTLAPGTTYKARLYFVHFSQINSTSYGQGVNAYAGYASQTQFPLVTTVNPDVERYGVVKGLFYVQTSTAGPVTDLRPYKFQVFTDGTTAGLTNVSVTSPGGFKQTLTANNGDSDPSLETDYLSPGGLDADYPPGNYVLTFKTSDQGTHIVTLPLPATPFPAAPLVVNYAAAQAIDPDRDFTVTWNAFPGGTVNDFAQFDISESVHDSGVFQTASPGQPGALNGTATGTTIPAHTLAPGSTYQARVLIAKGLGLDTSYGFGFSAYYSQTQLSLATTGVVAPPTLTINQIGPSQWHLHANGVLNQNYVIENTTSLTPPVTWQPFVNFQGSAGGFDFNDGVMRSRNFYRVRPVN